jgi:HK97 family phage portal protein
MLRATHHNRITMFDRLKNLLRPPEAKASRTARLITLESTGRARWTPRDYAALAREGYVGNAIVHRAVKLVAENAASCVFLLYEGAAERDRHPLLDLLTRPNPRQDGAAFFEALHAYLLLAGNAYVEAVTIEGADGLQVRELYCLRPDRMRVVPGADGWAEAYEYTAAGRTVRFDQSAPPVPPILHLTAFHPLDDHYGLAPLEAAAVAVDTHNAAARWNKSLLDNSARPSGALVYAGPEGLLLSERHGFPRGQAHRRA